MRVMETTVYRFDELSDRAKERARDWFREGALDYDWWDSIYEDAATCGEILGINLRQKPVKTMGGSTRYEPAIYFSGFYTQGAGARMEADYEYPKGKDKSPAWRIKDHAPPKWIDKQTGEEQHNKGNAELARIADALQDIQRRNFYGISARVRFGHGHGEHEMNTTVEVFKTINGDDREVDQDTDEAVRELMRDFMRWIYRQLEAEYEYRMSDEAVDEDIRANEYEFEEDGSRA